LVAISLVTMLGLAALAIDIVTLYVARAEAQRSADAAALAGAKMLVDSGLTTDSCNPALANAAQTLATTQAQAVAAQNNVAGQPPKAQVTFPNGTGTTTCPNAFGTNPQIKVVVQRTGLPTFFARIWNQALGTISATAVAEGYNPSNSAGLNSTGAVIPIAPRCVKPILLPNCDPQHTGHGGFCAGFDSFVDPVTGQITNPAGVIGENILAVQAACTGPPPGCTPPTAAVPGQYFPLGLSATALHLCPSCSSSSSGFQWDLECCNASTLACGQQAAVDYTLNPNGAGGAAATGGQCLIHQNPGAGQDQLDLATHSPMLFIAEDNNPFVGTSVQVGDHMMTSDSVVTFPLYDGVTVPPAGGSVTIIGFLQVFINQMDAAGSFNITILNVSGCGNSPAGTAVQGAATSVPVRLIQQP
jgi:hypothetical protein